MRTPLLAIVLGVMTLGAATVRPQSSLPGVTTRVERAGRYVEEYERTFAAIVSEEHQIQRLVRSDGRVRKTRELRSDFLLIKTGPQWAQVFRDVLEVDGKAVRNREDRLRRLFLETSRSAVQQAHEISQESARHNIGAHRIGNSPLLPMLFLHPRYSGRSRFAESGASLTFQEVDLPSLLKTRHGGESFNLPARGSLAVDEETGRILAGEFTAAGPPDTYSVWMDVHYIEEPRLKLMVPKDARERYWFEGKPKEDRIEVESTYANFRRFQVATDEQIKR